MKSIVATIATEIIENVEVFKLLPTPREIGGVGVVLPMPVP